MAEYGTFKFYNQMLQGEGGGGGGKEFGGMASNMLMPGGTIKARMVNAETAAAKGNNGGERSDNSAVSPVRREWIDFIEVPGNPRRTEEAPRFCFVG
jgi:hypothetical protein